MKKNCLGFYYLSGEINQAAKNTITIKSDKVVMNE